MNDLIKQALVTNGLKLSLTCTGLGITYSSQFGAGTSK